MKVQPINYPLNDEMVVGVQPAMSPDTDAGWRRRLNLFTGRSLSDIALSIEQQGRAGRLATRGRALSPGVVSGLEVDLEVEGDPPGQWFFRIAAGTGVTAVGENVRVLRDLRVKVHDLPVYAPRALLAGAVEDAGPGDADSGGVTGPPVSRMMGPSLSSLLEEVDVPRVGVLVLQPVTVEMVGEVDPDNTCEEDPQGYAFEDWQLADGCRLVYYAWPEEWLTLPERGQQWRNRLAYAVFNAEQSLGPADSLPWEGLGLPIALVAFADDDAWTPVFVDRYSVVREGGKAPPRRPLVSGAGSPFLWQARLQQFAEEVTGFSSDGDRGNIQVEDLAGEFRYLPPVGLLPTSALDTSEGRGDLQGRFFPYSYDVDAAPVPQEQLDAALGECGSLAPFDTAVPDQARLLVPVPQRWFEPDLLKVEQVSPEFQDAIDWFALERAEWLRRRDNVRLKMRSLRKSITGTAPPERRPQDDPDRLEDEDESLLTTPPLSPGDGAHLSPAQSGAHGHLLTGAAQTFTVNPGESLVAYVYLDPDNSPAQVMLRWGAGDLGHAAYWGHDRLSLASGLTGASAGPLPPAGCWHRLEVPANTLALEGVEVDSVAFLVYGGGAAWGHVGAAPASGDDRLWFEGEDGFPGGTTESEDILAAPDNEGWVWVEPDNLLAPMEGNYQTAQGNGLRTVTPVETLKAGFTGALAGEAGELDARGLEGFIDYLEAKVKRADSRIDFGYLKVNTDIYRIRQLALGTEAASRLAVSPSLATIAKGETATATREQISQFYQRLGQAGVGGQEEVDDSGTDTSSTGSTGSTSGGDTGGESGGFSTLRLFSPESREASGGFTFMGGMTGATPTAPQPEEEPSPTASEFLRQEASFQFLGYSPAVESTAEDVIGKSPILGKTATRTTTIAERFQTPKAPEAKYFAAGTKHDIVRDISGLDISLDGIQVPGLATGGFDPSTGQPVRGAPKSLTDFTEADFGGILADPDDNFKDEAAFFSAGVDLLDHTVSVLSSLEARVQEYRQAADACRRTLDEVRQQVVSADRRLKTINDGLAEARHDVSVARALLAEEEGRIEAINDRRDQVIREHVHFLVYHRPRSTDLLAGVPVRRLNPGLAQEPVPTCLNEDVDIPAELQEAVELLRESPVNWFVKVRPLLDRLDRPRILVHTIQEARERARRFSSEGGLLPFQSGGGPLGGAIQKVLSARRQAVAQRRSITAGLDLSGVAAQGWGLARDRGREVLSLGDLIDGRHGNSSVVRQAGLELDRIGRVAACLHRSFGQVLPAVRLEWADDLSQFDEPVNLRNLAGLPRWGEIEYLQRQELQMLVDWLYQRVDPRESEAVALVSDLVRIAILLASHAPVDEIIAGRVAEPAPVRKGGLVRLGADMAKLRVGMGVRLFQSNRVVAMGVVDDLYGSQATARIEQAPGSGVQLVQNDRAQFFQRESAALRF